MAGSARQAVPVPGSRRDGYSAVYRNAQHPDALLRSPWNEVRTAAAAAAAAAEPDSTDQRQVTTVFEAFERSCRLYPEHDCLGSREFVGDNGGGTWSPYRWTSYAQTRRRRDQFGAGVLHLQQTLGIALPEHNCIGIYGINCPEWAIADLANNAFGMVTVALYDTLGPDSARHIISQTDMTVVVTTLDHIPALIRLRASAPSLRVVISMDPLNDREPFPSKGKLSLLTAWAEQAGLSFYSFDQVEGVGRAHPASYRRPSPDTIITINYTSGTTGNSKGALLTHANAVAAMTGPSNVFAQAPGDVYISYLPLAHIFDRCAVALSLSSGAAVGFYHGDLNALVDDIQALRPTILCAVPRLLTRMTATIQKNTINASGLKGTISRIALATKTAKMDAGGDNHHILWDRLWSKKIHQALGGRLRVILTGSAPAPVATLKFLRAALACIVVEGYGLTETYAVVAVSQCNDYSLGHVGPIVPCGEIRLRDLPEMGYFSTDSPHPRGELLVRGAQVFKGYYKEPEKTAEALDSDGWFATGDVCEIDELGRCYIIDRAKSFFKLSQGEYISPGRIEAIYSGCDLVQQVYVHGNSIQSYLVAIINPNPDTFAPWASEILNKQILPTDIDDIKKACADKRVRIAMVKWLDHIGQEKALKGFERIRNVYLKVDSFVSQPGAEEMLTPTYAQKKSQMRFADD